MVPVVDVYSDGNEPSAQWWAAVRAEMEEQPWEEHEPDGGEAWSMEWSQPLPRRRTIESVRVYACEPEGTARWEQFYLVPTGEYGFFSPADIQQVKRIICTLLEAQRDGDLLIQVQERGTWVYEENRAEPGGCYQVSAEEILPYFRRLWSRAHREKAVISTSDF